MPRNKWTQKITNLKYRTPVIIFLLILLIYLSFPTKNYYWDAVDFALIIERANGLNVSLLHPNHLLYNYLGYLSYISAKTFSSDIRAIEVLQIISSFFGAAGVTVFYLILRYIFRSEYINLCLTALLAFSATWWKYSTDGDSYIPGIFFLLICFYLILPKKKPRPILLALLHIAAMLLHQLAIFFFPVLFIGLYLQTKVDDNQKRVSALLKFSLTDFLITFGAFCFSFYYLSKNFIVKDFFRWLTWYSPEVGFVSDPLKILSLLIKSHSKLLFDGRFNFFSFNFIDTILLALLIISVLFFIYKTIRNREIFGQIWKTIRNKEFYTGNIFVLCILWILPFFLFLAVFIPGNSFYRLFYVPPVVILFGVIIEFVARSKRTESRHLVFGVAIVFLVNFIFFVHPSNKIREDSPLTLALEMNKQFTGNSVIFYDRIDPDNNLVKYYNQDVEWIKIENAEEFQTNLVKSFGENNSTWIDDSAFKKINSTPELLRFFSANFEEKERFQLNDPAHSVKFIRVEPISKNDFNFK